MQCFTSLFFFLYIFKSDHDKDHKESSSHQTHSHGFGHDAEKVVKDVKQALANGEGCRVCHFLF